MRANYPVENMEQHRTDACDTDTKCIENLKRKMVILKFTFWENVKLTQKAFFEMQAYSSLSALYNFFVFSSNQAD